jgi:tRNA pseudouridine13 synthase
MHASCTRSVYAYTSPYRQKVDMDGNIARLERLEVPKDTSKQSNNATDAEEPEGSDRKRAKIESSTDATSEQHAENSPVDENAPFDWDKCKQELNKFIDETAAHEAVDFLKSKSNDEPPKEDDTKFYILPAITDKETRRSIHQYIKSPAISSIARADNHEGRIRIWHVKYQSGMPADTFGRANGGEGAGRNNRPSKKKAADRPAWPKDRPDFLRFVLYKENVDTHTALKDVVRSGRLNPKRGVSFAGMKDKRGVTTQFCSVYRTEKEQLLALNSHRIGAGGGNSIKGGFNIIRVGNFSYSGEEVKLGSLNGNRFDIVLRNVDIGDVADDPTQKAKLVKERLEAAAMGLRQVGFINYFGMQRFGKSNDTHEVGIAILKGDYETALDIIMREKDTDEPPRQAEARKKWMNRFKSIDVANDEDGAKAAEMKCAKSILNDLGRFLGVEKSVIGSLLKHPRDYKRAYTSIAKNMRSMYLHAYQSYLWNHVASHRIESGGSIEVRAGDLVLINDKTLSEGGSGTSGLKGKEVKVLSDDDVATGQYSITDVVLPLVGSKIRYPEGSSGDMLNKLLQKDGISKDAFAKIGSIDREIALGGDYRKVMCRPSDVSFEVLTYKDPRQPLIQTDLMKVMGTEIDAVPIDVNSVNKPTSAPDDKHAVEEEKTEEEADVVFGMVVGFSLPPSSYATIALRELTKRPTSSDYQSKLELSGRCERNHTTV